MASNIKVKEANWKLYGFLPYDTSPKSSFALPLFHKEDNAKLFVQITDRFSSQTSMKPYGQSDDDPLIRYRGDYTCDPAIPLFVFIKNNGDPLVGPLQELIPALREHVANDPSRVGVTLQILELVGSPQERRSAREEMAQRIKAISGESAARQFLDVSTAHNVLTDLFLRNAAVSASRSDLIDATDLIARSFDTSKNMLIPEDLIHKVKPLLRKNWTDVVSGFREEMPASNTVWVPRSDQVDPDLSFSNARISRIYQWLRATGRQEERLAVIIRTYLEDPGAGRWLARHYVDGGTFANTGIALMREAVNRPGLYPERYDLIFAGVINRLYREAFPYQRGQFLADMAKHLGGVQAIAAVISEKAISSSSFAVVPFREQILLNLANAKKIGKLTL